MYINFLLNCGDEPQFLYAYEKKYGRMKKTFL